MSITKTDIKKILYKGNSLSKLYVLSKFKSRCLLEICIITYNIYKLIYYKRV